VQRFLAVGLCLTAVTAIFASAASAVSTDVGARAVLSSPTAKDDAPTIAFYKQVQASYRTVPAVRVRRHGFLWYSDTAPGSLVRWVSAKQPPPGEGYKPATESILVLLTSGRVTKYVDTAKAPGLPALTIIEGSGGLAVALAKKGNTCFHPASRAGDVAGWGSPFIGVYGNFSPMQTQGNTVIVTSTYPWLKSEQATEVDRISATTKHLDSYTVKVTGTSPITFSATNQDIPKPSPVPGAAPRC
jgi:hypothetical protein